VFRVLPSLRSRRRGDDDQPRPASNDHSQRRLFLLGTAFMARGMSPKDAYSKAVYYTTGPGRGQTWISILAEQDRERQAAE
jgi:hypothetical protein